MTKIITNNADDEFHEIADMQPLFELQVVPADASEKWFIVLTNARLVGYQTDDGDLLDLDTHDVEVAYRVHGTYYYDIDDADEALRKEFAEMCREVGIMLGEDKIADNEAYSAWTDALCKGNDICEDTYNDGGAYHE